MVSRQDEQGRSRFHLQLAVVVVYHSCKASYCGRGMQSKWEFEGHFKKKKKKQRFPSSFLSKSQVDITDGMGQIRALRRQRNIRPRQNERGRTDPRQVDIRLDFL
jgi:hypothetical protein